MTYWRQRPGQALGPVTPNITVVATNVRAIVGEPVRILVNHPQAITDIQSLCQEEFADQCYPEIYYRPDGTINSLCLFASQANKGAALALVLDRLEIAPEHVLAIGDNPTDLSMFPYARLGVAMANAPDAVKQSASIVAPSNDEEGVAWALKRFVLSQ